MTGPRPTSSGAERSVMSAPLTLAIPSKGRLQEQVQHYFADAGLPMEKAAGARGYYIPQLIIYHHIPRERLTKRYHRRWCFYRGISLAQLDRERPEPVTHLCGVPRYLFGKAGRSMLNLARALCSRHPDPERIFSSELPLWDLAGFIYGKYFVRPSHDRSSPPSNRVLAPG